MKKITFYLVLLFIVPPNLKLRAQTFNVQYDSVWITYTGQTSGLNNIIVPSSGSNVTLQWKVLSTDFPVDWLTGSAFCDNILCYDYNTIYGMSLIQTSGIYYAGVMGDFGYGIDLSNATSYGSHYITLELFNQAIPTDIATQTYIISYDNGNMQPQCLYLYPNPVTDELSVSYNPSDGPAPVQIHIYNALGQLVINTSVTGQTTIVNMSQLPSGFYFIHLLDAQGVIMANGNIIHQ